MPELQVTLTFNPALDAAKLNVMLGALKRALGPLGKEIQLIDGDKLAAELKAVSAAAAPVGEQVKKIGDETEKTKERAKGLGKAFALNQLYGAVAAVSSSLQQLARPFVELDTQVKNIGTLGVENFERYGDLALDLSRRVPDSAAAIAAGVYDAISAGITGTQEQIIGFVEQASKVAVSGMTDTRSAVNGLTSVLNAYKLTAADAGRVSDTFFAAIKLGKTTFPELNTALANVIPAASAAGVSFEEVAAAIAQMTALGVPTAQASTQLRQAIIEVQKPAEPLAAVMAQVGLNAANIGEEIRSKGLIPTLQKVQQAAAGMGMSMTQVFSSSEAASAALLVTGDNAARASATFEGVRLEIQARAAEQAYAVASEGIEAKTKILLNNVQAAFSSLFSVIGSGAVTAAGAVASLAPTLTALSGLKNIVPEGAVNSAKVLIDGKLMPSIQKIAPALFAAGEGGKLAFVGLSKAAIAFATNPVFLTIAGIAAVVAATKLLSDALTTTAQERAEDISEQKKMVEGQIEEAESRRTQAESTKSLAQEYVNLGRQMQSGGVSAADAAAKQERMKVITEQLNQQYPGVIQRTGDLSANLESVQKVAARSSSDLARYSGELSKLNDEIERLTSAEIANNVEVAAEDLKDSLFDAGATLMDKASDFALGLFGGKGSTRKLVDDYVDQMGKGIKGALNSNELNDAVDVWRKDLGEKVAAGEITAKQYNLIVGHVKKLAAAQGEWIASLGEGFKKMQDTGVSGLGAMNSLQAAADAALRARESATGAGGKELTVSERITQIQDKLKQIEADRLALAVKGPMFAAKMAGLKEQEVGLQKELDSLQGKSARTGESAYERAQRQLDQEMQSLQTQERMAAIARETERLAAGRERNASDELTDADERLNALRQELSVRQRQADLAVKTRAGDREVTAARQQVADITADIAEQENKVLELQQKQTAETATLAREQRARAAATLEYQIEIRAASRSDLVGELQRQLETVQREQVSAAVTAARDLEDEARSLTLKIRDLRRQDLADATEALNRRLEMERAAGEKRLERENALIGRLIALQDALGATRIDTESSDAIDRLEQQKKRELSIAGDNEAAKEQIERVFAARRESAEQDAERRRQVHSERTRGQALLQEAAHQAKLLEIQRSQKQRQLDMAEPGSKEAEALKYELETIEETLREKQDTIGLVLEEMSGSFAEGLAGLFSGSPEAMTDSFRKMMGALAGILERLASAAIVKMVLDWLNVDPTAAAIPFWIKVGVIPLVTAAASGLVHSLIGPVLSSLTSFSTGGRVDEPTLAVVGDAGRAGMASDTEWILRQGEIQTIVHGAIHPLAQVFVREIATLRDEIRAVNARFYLEGTAIRAAGDRALSRRRERYR